MEKEISGGGYSSFDAYKQHLIKIYIPKAINYTQLVNATPYEEVTPAFGKVEIRRRENATSNIPLKLVENAKTINDLLEIENKGTFGKTEIYEDIKTHIGNLYSNYLCYNDANYFGLDFYEKITTPEKISITELYATPGKLEQIITLPWRTVSAMYKQFNIPITVTESTSTGAKEQTTDIKNVFKIGGQMIELSPCAQKVYDSAVKYTTKPNKQKYMNAIKESAVSNDCSNIANISDTIELNNNREACLKEYTSLINDLEPDDTDSNFIKRLLGQARRSLRYRKRDAESAFITKLYQLKMQHGKTSTAGGAEKETVKDGNAKNEIKNADTDEKTAKDYDSDRKKEDDETDSEQTIAEKPATYYEYFMNIINVLITDYNGTNRSITNLLIVCILLILFSIGYSLMMLFDVLSNISFKDGTAIPLNKNTFTYTVASSEDPRQSRYPFVYVLIANCLALQAVAFAWIYKYRGMAMWDRGGTVIPIAITTFLLVLFNAGEFFLTNAVSHDYFLLHFLGGLLLILGIVWFFLSHGSGEEQIKPISQIILLVVTIQVIIAFIGTYSYYKGSLVEISAAANSVKTFNDYVYDHIYKNSDFLNDLIDNYDRHDNYKAISVALKNLSAKGVQTAELTETQPILSYYGLLARISTVFGFKQDDAAAAVAVDKAKVYFTINLFYALSQTNTVGALDMFKPENIVLRSKVMPSDYLLNEAVYINDVSSMFIAAKEGPSMTAQDIGNLLTYMSEVNNSANSFSTSDAIGPFLNMSVGVTIFQLLPIIMAVIGYSIHRRLKGIREEAAAAKVELEKRDAAAKGSRDTTTPTTEAANILPGLFTAAVKEQNPVVVQNPNGKLLVGLPTQGGKKHRRPRK